MPTLDENKRIWSEIYHWKDRGEEWSSAWGGPGFQWSMTVLPRIQRFLPAGTILEIGCGFGRWTSFLLAHCDRIVGIDLAEQCVAACRERFSGESSAQFLVTDGYTLPGVEADSVDFVFSFDSLVHADRAVLDAYLAEIARILRPEGAAFIHHSNLGAYRSALDKIRSVEGLEEELAALGCWETHLHLRDPGPDAVWFAEAAGRHGLRCITQEKVPWGTERLLIDCFSTLVRAESPLAGPCQQVDNRDFPKEIEYARRISEVYRAPGAPDTTPD